MKKVWKLSALTLACALSTTVLLGGCNDSEQDIVKDIGSVINSNITSTRESEASYLNDACKTFQAGLCYGSINSGNIGSGSYSVDVPDRTDSQDVKNEAANTATVADAAEYNGLNDLLYNISDFVVIRRDGFLHRSEIVYKGSADGDVIEITEDTKLSEIYGEVS